MKPFHFCPLFQADQAALEDELDPGWLMERRKKKKHRGAAEGKKYHRWPDLPETSPFLLPTTRDATNREARVGKGRASREKREGDTA